MLACTHLLTLWGLEELCHSSKGVGVLQLSSRRRGGGVRRHCSDWLFGWRRGRTWRRRHSVNTCFSILKLSMDLQSSLLPHVCRHTNYLAHQCLCRAQQHCWNQLPCPGGAGWPQSWRLHSSATGLTLVQSYSTKESKNTGEGGGTIGGRKNTYI